MKCIGQFLRVAVALIALSWFAHAEIFVCETTFLSNGVWTEPTGPLVDGVATVQFVGEGGWVDELATEVYQLQQRVGILEEERAGVDSLASMRVTESEIFNTTNDMWSFDGTSSGITIEPDTPASTNFARSMPISNYTYSAWAHATDIGAADRYIFYAHNRNDNISPVRYGTKFYYSTSQGGQFLCVTWGNGNMINTFNLGRVTNLYVANPGLTNQAMLTAITRGIEDRTYFLGSNYTVNAGSVTSTWNISEQDINSGIGYLASDTPDAWFEGEMSHVRIYHRTLAGLELTNLQAAGNSQVAGTVSTNDLMYYFPMTNDVPRAYVDMASNPFWTNLPDNITGPSPYVIWRTNALGQVDKCVEFDGVDDKLSGPGNGAEYGLSFTNGSFSVLVNREGVLGTGNESMIYDKTTSLNEQDRITLSFTNTSTGFIKAYYDSNAERQEIYSSSQVTSGWHHITLTIKQSDMSLYVDGILEASIAINVSLPGTPWSKNSPHTLGPFNRGAMKLDRPAFYPWLSSNEVYTASQNILNGLEDIEQ